MRTASVLFVLAGLPISVLAQTTASSVAVQTGTIQPGGPRPPTNGDRYLNIEGANNGSFASYGVARWDLAAVRTAFDAAYGVGNWHVTGLELELTQDNAAFSSGGQVRVYYTPDDSVDIKTLASPLFWPFLDPVTQQPDLPLGNGGAPVLSYSFVVATTATLDRYTQSGSFQNGAPLSANEVLELAPDLVDHITSQGLLTLVFEDAGPEVAATYRGQESFSGRVGPNLFITAEANSGASCYANCDSSTAVPFLNVNDFICFQQKYAAGDSYANCDNSTTAPVLNVNDFICFQASFAAGCSAP
jgi:hypothetical protein